MPAGKDRGASRFDLAAPGSAGFRPAVKPRLNPVKKPLSNRARLHHSCTNSRKKPPPDGICFEFVFRLWNAQIL